MARRGASGAGAGRGNEDELDFEGVDEADIAAILEAQMS